MPESCSFMPCSCRVTAIGRPRHTRTRARSRLSASWQHAWQVALTNRKLPALLSYKCQCLALLELSPLLREAVRGSHVLQAIRRMNFKSQSWSQSCPRPLRSALRAPALGHRARPSSRLFVRLVSGVHSGRGAKFVLCLCRCRIIDFVLAPMLWPLPLRLSLSRAPVPRERLLRHLCAGMHHAPIHMR